MRRIYEYDDLQPVLEQLLQDKESGDNKKDFRF